MASGDNHQQWAYPHFTQPGQATGQAGNFINQGFGGDGDNEINTNAFAIPQQWQSQDNHFLHDNGFSSFQPQSSTYSVQHFPENNAHIQSHQHPQTFTTPISMDGPSEISWEYDFGFDSNPLTGMSNGGISYGTAGGLQQSPNANGMPSASSFPQGMSNNMPGQQQQQQFTGGSSSGNMYTPNQVAAFGQNTHQSPPQPIAQPRGQRQVMDYQQPTMNHQPQSQPQQHHQAQHQQPSSQHSQPPSQHQHPSNQHRHPPNQHQHPPAQHHHPVVQHQHAPAQHQRPNPLQAASHQPNQLQQNINHVQPAPRIGTPQSADHAAQPRQPPFHGRNVPPFSMQQQAQQISTPDGRGSPAIPFSTPQQIHAQPPNGSKASPTAATAQTTQSRFVPQQMVPMQRPSQGPAPSTSNTAVPNVMQMLNNQQQNMQPNLHNSGQLTVLPNVQPKANVQMTSPSPSHQPVARGLAPPRILHEDRNSPMGSRHVAFSPAHILAAGDDPESNSTIDEIPDPAQVQAQSLGRFLTLGPSGQARTLAFEALGHWTRAVEQDNVAVQNEWEQRLKKYLGGSLPKYYEDKLQEARAAKKKASGSRGPERNENRPKNEADAAEWDALGIVYLENPQPTGAEIGEAVAAYGKLIRGHSAEFQKLKQKLKTAKEADSDTLKDQIARKLEVIQRAVAAANAWGDAQVVANLGGNQKLISDFVSCLIHANNSGDHNGKAPKAVLRLLSAVTTIEKDFLMSSLQFAKISKKFESKGDGEVKQWVKKIKENAESRKEKSGSDEEGTSTPEPDQSLKGVSTNSSPIPTAAGDATKRKFTGTAATRAPSTSSMAKRPREEETDAKPAKRLAGEQTPGQPGQKTAPAKVVVSAPNTTQSKLFGSGMLGTKKPLPRPTTKAAPVKADGSVSTTKLEVKKELLKKPDATKIRKVEPVKAEASSTSKLGGISALLDSISKPKTTGRSTPDKEAKIDRDETPEEKTRRLRKESRRHLRVSWKEGDELTQVRTFHKDADEDEGRASNMIRDAHDDRSEGMMLKQGLQGGSQDEDEEEEDELPYRPWFQPTGIDYTLIPQDRREKSFITRGGQLEFETQQQKLIAERENKELMVIYTDPSDIPPTPKSPNMQTQEDTDMHAGSVYDLAQDESKLAEIHLRWAEANSRGLSWARLNALRRAQRGQSASLSDVANMHAANSATFNGASTAHHSTAHQTQPLSHEDQILALLTSDRVKNWRDSDSYDSANPKTHRRYDYPDPETQNAADLVESVAEKLKGKIFPAVEPPEWMKDDAARIAEWWHGYNKDRQRVEQRAQQQVVMQSSQPAAVAQSQAVPEAAQSAADPNAAAWAAYYAQLQQQQQGQAQNMDPNTAAWAAYYAQQHQQQQVASAQPAGDSNAQLQAVLAALSATPAQAQQQTAAQSSTDPQLQALLASLGATSTAQQPAQTYQAQSAQFQAPDPSDPKYMDYIMSLATGQLPNQGQQQQHANHGQSRDDSREHSRDREHKNRERELEGMHPSRRAQNHTKKGAIRDAGGPAHLRGINRDKIGTKPCTFYAKGLCQKGDQCTFRHD